eukprot:gene56406-62706_t
MLFPAAHSAPLFPDLLPLIRTLLRNSSFAALEQVGHCRVYQGPCRALAGPLRWGQWGARDREMVPIGPYSFPYARGDLQKKVLRRWRSDHHVPVKESTLAFAWREFGFGGAAPAWYPMAYSGIFA